MSQQEKAATKEIQELRERLKFYEESPYETAYKATVNTIEKLSNQLIDKNIDLFNVEDKPKFEMIHKFMTELSFYLKTQEEIRSKMNPDIAKQIERAAKNKKLEETDKSLAL